MTAVTAVANAVGGSHVVSVLGLSWRFSPPTYQVAVRREGNLWVNTTRSVSVVRVNGVLTQVQSPAGSQLVDAGTEGVDWFLGGHDYSGLSQSVRDELVAAGYTVTEN